MDDQYYEICIGPGPFITDEDFWMCIRGARQPSLEEAEQFYAEDVEKFGGNVLAVNLLSPSEASAFYDLSHEENWPVFGT